MQPPAARPSSASGRNKSVPVDREALGLTALKPSEMVEGLEKAAKRAEKMEARESAKRKLGGGMNPNAALHVDDTGARWARGVKIGIAVTVLVVGLALGVMWHLSNRSKVPPRQAGEETRQRLVELSRIVPRIKLFDADEEITVEKLKPRILEKLEEEIKDVDTQIAQLKESKRPTEEYREQKKVLESLKDLNDAWGNPFEFTIVESDSVQVGVKGKTVAANDPLAPVTIRVRVLKPKAPAQPPKK
jgi:hypothetical protein